MSREQELEKALRVIAEDFKCLADVDAGALKAMRSHPAICLCAKHYAASALAEILASPATAEGAEQGATWTLERSDERIWLKCSGLPMVGLIEDAESRPILEPWLRLLGSASSVRLGVRKLG